MARNDNTTPGSIALWLCNGLLTTLILLRLILRRWRRQQQQRWWFTAGDYWALVALGFSAARMVGDYYTNEYGTPLGLALLREKGIADGTWDRDFDFTALERDNLVLAGKLTIANRTATAVVLWSLKMAVMDMLRTPLRRLQRELLVLYLIYTVLAGSFLVSVLSAFLECQDLSLNWKLFPDPDKCSGGTAWITTYEISNAVTNVMLFLLVLLFTLKVRISKWDRLVLLVLGPGAGLITVNIFRLVNGLPFTDILHSRVIWGSIEVAIATSIATLPIIYILLWPRGEEQQSEDPDKQRIIVGNVRQPARVPSDSSEYDPELQRPHHQGLWNPEFSWDNSAPTETGDQSHGSKPVSTASVSPSTTPPTRPEASHRESYASFRNSRLSSRPVSNMSNMSNFPGWFELDNVDERHLIEEGPSHEADNPERVGGVFVAKASRFWVNEERPQIVTIRSRRDHGQV